MSVSSQEDNGKKTTKKATVKKRSTKGTAKKKPSKEPKTLKPDEVKARMKELVNIGKKKGYITYEDIDKSLPPEYTGFDGSFLETMYENLEKASIMIRESDPDTDEENDEKEEVSSNNDEVMEKIIS